MFAKICSTLFSCVLTIIKTWGWTGALTGFCCERIAEPLSIKGN
jgi:hypothetical protein